MYMNLSNIWVGWITKGFSCFTLCFVLLDSRVSLCFCCWSHVFHFCFVLLDLRVSLNVLYSWMFVFHFMLCAVGLTCFTLFCAVGFTCFTLYFVLLDLRILLCVLCCWFTCFTLFCAVGFSCFTFVLCCWMHVFHFIFCAARFAYFTLCFVLLILVTLLLQSAVWLYSSDVQTPALNWTAQPWPRFPQKVSALAQHSTWISPVCSFLRFPCTSSPLGPNSFLIPFLL